MHYRFNWWLLALALQLVALHGTAAETRLRVVVSIDDQPLFVQRMQNELNQLPNAQRSTPRDWIRDKVIAVLNDLEEGGNLIVFAADGPANYDLMVSIGHTPGYSWPNGDVVAKVTIPSLCGATTCFVTVPLLEPLTKVASEPRYIDDWVRPAFHKVIEAGTLHSRLLQFVPIKARAVIKRGRMTSDLNPPLLASMVLAVRWAHGERYFVHCDQSRLGGPILASQQASPSCAPSFSWNGPPRSWDAVYIVKFSKAGFF